MSMEIEKQYTQKEVDKAMRTGMWIGALITALCFAVLTYFLPLPH